MTAAMGRMRATTMCGSSYYMAPEVWRGEPYGTAADVYGLARVAYEICSLYGKPYAAYDPKTMYRKVIERGKRLSLPYLVYFFGVHALTTCLKSWLSLALPKAPGDDAETASDGWWYLFDPGPAYRREDL